MSVATASKMQSFTEKATTTLSKWGKPLAGLASLAAGLFAGPIVLAPISTRIEEAINNSGFIANLKSLWGDKVDGVSVIMAIVCFVIAGVAIGMLTIKGWLGPIIGGFFAGAGLRFILDAVGIALPSL